MMENNYAFIDSQNLNLGVRSEGWELDFKKFRLYLRNKYKVTRALLFIGFIRKNQTLYSKLQSFGYEIIFKPTLQFKKSNRVLVKGNVDAELVLNCMINLNKFDKAIIISGDGDFYCLIEYLVTTNKLKNIIVPNHRYSSLLGKFNKYISVLERERNKLRYKKKTETRVRSKP